MPSDTFHIIVIYMATSPAVWKYLKGGRCKNITLNATYLEDESDVLFDIWI